MVIFHSMLNYQRVPWNTSSRLNSRSQFTHLFFRMFFGIDQNPHPSSRALADMAHWATGALRHSGSVRIPVASELNNLKKMLENPKKRWWLAHDPPHIRHHGP